jgi:hypothetical protein
LVTAGDVPVDWKRAHPDFTPQTLFKYWTDYPHKESPIGVIPSVASDLSAC